ncbi:hypothetical protein L2744_21180 [Shewanella profunda]|uniref:hypothetical protein n=1 Tax=Shewanella profunda TaxID=254793 RepID=UPI00200E46FE|nr:hypothetical protein [Shewanella profunda]MCL1092065.1 hypothetical protein [Shewanella profunda]
MKDRTGTDFWGLIACTVATGVHHPLGVVAGRLNKLRESGHGRSCASMHFTTFRHPAYQMPS